MSFLKKLLPALVVAAVVPVSGAAFESDMAKYKVAFYGHVKTDAMYDNHNLSTLAGGDYLTYTDTTGPNSKDFRVSARATRMGLDLGSPDGLDAKIEMDFLGALSGTSATPRIRHAYITMRFERFKRLQILAGQTWHLTPLELPDTNNEFAFGYSGCLWFRAPQVRLTYDLSDSLKVAAAAVRPNIDQSDSQGTHSGLPLTEAQAEYKLGAMVFTLAGAYGAVKNTATQAHGDVWLGDLGFRVPVGIVTVNGQLWTGTNLADFFGGIGQLGYGTGEIHANGGFLDVKVKPKDWLWFNAAYGVDDPRDDQVANLGRTQNQRAMGNVSVLLGGVVTSTTEVSYNLTRFKDSNGVNGRDYKSGWHYQWSLKFPFRIVRGG
ncbi:MAG: DcaP family trimeric outer membrane transporter [Elusimicrobiota bacterium]|jgi:hypothetical protein